MSVELVTVREAQHPLFVGVDVGGTSIKVGIVDNKGRTIAFTSFPTEDEKGPQFAIDRMKVVIEELLSSASLALDDIAVVGLATPGTMDIPAGMILSPPNMPGWRNFPVRDALSEALGKPVAYGNDAGAAALGEFWVGSGKAFRSIVMVTLGTGVGSGIIIDGVSLDGVHSHGAECGHMVIDTSPNAPMCGCGKRGHLEVFTSATGLIRRTREAISAGKQSILANQLADGAELTGLMIAEAAEEANDQLAVDLILETADYLAIGLSHVIYLIDPSAIILGGAMNFGGKKTNIGTQFIERVRKKTCELIFELQTDKIDFHYAELGGDAGYIGAAGFARNLHNNATLGFPEEA